MLKMVVADDDVLVLETIGGMFEWETFGIQIVGFAKDGEEALRLCEVHQPHILLTDIKMPLISGLEVAMALREQQKDIRIMIISGVQDFDFARTALEIKVEGYILKPIQVDEVSRVIRKVVGSIQLDLNKEQMLSGMRRQIQEHHSQMRDIFLRNLIEGNYTCEKEVEDKLTYFGIDWKIDRQAVVAVLTIDHYAETVRDKGELDKQLLSFAVIKVAGDVLENYGNGYAVMLSENRFALLLDGKRQRSVSHIDIGREVVDNLQSLLSISASMGIGNAADTLLELGYSYENACQVVSQKFYRGTGVILAAEDILCEGDYERIEYSSWFAKLFTLRSTLLTELKHGDSDRLQQCLTQLFDLLSQKKVFGTEYVRSMCTELAASVCHLFYDLDFEKSHEKIDPKEIINQVLLADTVHDMKTVIADACSLYIEIYVTQYQNRHSDLVNRVVHIIDQRYMENLTIGSIANEVFVTQNYICLIFKREMGITLNTYLTKVRLSEACRLLTDTQLKIWQIAQLTGYENTHYFSTVFKKTIGMQPLQYRQQDMNKI